MNSRQKLIKTVAEVDINNPSEAGKEIRRALETHLASVPAETGGDYYEEDGNDDAKSAMDLKPNTTEYSEYIDIEMNISAGLHILYINMFKFLYSKKSTELFSDFIFLKEHHIITRFNDELGSFSMLFIYKGQRFKFTITKVEVQQNVVRHFASLKSVNVVSNIEFGNTYDLIFKEAIINSNLKGNIIDLRDPESFTYSLLDFSKHTLDNVFLPKSLTIDLNNYFKVCEKFDNYMRYLFVGSPGTGKTESLLSITNQMNQRGVTIIKAYVSPSLDMVVDLATILAPSIIYFDDLDIYLGNRNNGAFSEGLGFFLDLLDGSKKIPHNVGILSTTNSLSLLDIAVSRPGRFNKVLFFGELSNDNIKHIILKSIARFEAPQPYIDVLTDIDVIEIFKKYTVSGAYIFNIIEVMFYNLANELLNLEVSDIVNYIESDIKQTNMAMQTNLLSTTASIIKQKNDVGFSTATIREPSRELPPKRR